MIINHNMMAQNANRMANVNQSNASKAMAQLSSGLRINSAADDAAGLSISEKMKGQINGLNQASSNAQNGVSLVQTADGALSETTSELQRMRELAVQSASDTNTPADRAAMQTETTQLIDQIDNIANTTQFNTKNLLDGGAGLDTIYNAKTVGGANSDWIDITGGNASTKTGSVGITSALAATGATQDITVTGATIGPASFTVNGTTVSYTADITPADNALAARTALSAVATSLGITVGGSGAHLIITNSNVGGNSNLIVTSATNGLTLAALNATTNGADATITTDATGGDTQILATDMVASGNTINVVSGSFKGMSLSLNSSVMSAAAADNLSNFTIKSNGTLTLQIGANENQTMSMSINDMRAAALGVSNIDMRTQAGAASAITAITDATALVSNTRAQLGAYQNRLTSTINNLGTTSQNMTAAQSQITDVDMAATMSEYSKDNIESQAAQAMIAQANQQPQQVLQLLR